MSYASLRGTMDRITTAIVESPIAVFDCGRPYCFNSVFADTVLTQRIIAAGRCDLIGVYHRGMDIDAIRAKLREVLDKRELARVAALLKERRA